MIICVLCNGYGRIDHEYYNEACRNCDGTGKTPWSNAWRPHEPSIETKGPPCTNPCCRGARHGDDPCPPCGCDPW